MPGQLEKSKTFIICPHCKEQWILQDYNNEMKNLEYVSSTCQWDLEFKASCQKCHHYFSWDELI